MLADFRLAGETALASAPLGLGCVNYDLVLIRLLRIPAYDPVAMAILGLGIILTAALAFVL